MTAMPDKNKQPSAEKLRRIRAIATDLDGVMTDGYVIPLSDGDLLRRMDVKDSFALRFAILQGIIVGVISGGKTEALRLRCLNLGVAERNLHLGCRGKLKVFRQFLRDNDLGAEEVLYMGDDVADIQVLAEAGIAMVPSDAAAEAVEVADYVSRWPGGHWCVREAVEMVLKAKGLWKFDPDSFEKYF